jgi:transcriptional regulator GlxA family with amidase domain
VPASVELPVPQRALGEVFGDYAPHARLRDASAFKDEGWNSLPGPPRETKMGVADVALEVGRANPSHFARLFRRGACLSPGDYSRQR